MKKYRNGSVVIEAVEINRENLAEIVNLEGVTVQANNATGSFSVYVGREEGGEGDYVVLDPKPRIVSRGEFDYEPVGDE